MKSAKCVPGGSELGGSVLCEGAKSTVVASATVVVGGPLWSAVCAVSGWVEGEGGVWRGRGLTEVAEEAGVRDGELEEGVGDLELVLVAVLSRRGEGAHRWHGISLALS